MKTLRTLVLASVAVFSMSVQAAVFDRGGGLIYDDVLNVTWLQDADLAETNTFGISGVVGGGYMNWNTALEWTAAMNAAKYLGIDNWRLPTTLPIGGTGYNTNFSADGSTDWGFNIKARSSEMAFMFYVNLGNKAQVTVAGDPQVGYGIGNSGPFRNLRNGFYWSNSDVPSIPGYAWVFDMGDGSQAGYLASNHDFLAWAVRDGDVAAVPEPETYALLLSGLCLLGAVASKRNPH